MSTATSLVDISDKEQQIAGRINSAITNGLAVSERAGGVRFVNAGEVAEFAKMMAVANSGVRKHLRGNPGACLAICVQAVEWGMSPYAVANKSYFVNDQIAFESQLVQAVILKRAPIKGRLKFDFTGEGQNRVCRAWARLRDDPDEIVEYVSPLFKDINPKNSPLWKSDPDQQFCYYAGRALCRRHFPDVLLGVYAEDEFIGSQPMVDVAAREVAPSRKLSARFDAIASSQPRSEPEKVARESVPPAGRQHPPHDPETGVVDEVEDEQGPDAGEAATSADGGEPSAPATVADSPARIALLEKLRAKAEKGSAVLKRAMGGLSDTENGLLVDADDEALMAIAKAADEAKGTGTGTA